MVYFEKDSRSKRGNPVGKFIEHYKLEEVPIPPTAEELKACISSKRKHKIIENWKENGLID
jgi:hypothetical protein